MKGKTIIGIATLLLPLLASCVKSELVTISVSPEYVTIVEGETAILSVAVEPAKYASEVVWYTDDSGIAEVDAFGKVTAVHEGVTHVYAQVGNVSADCRVNVKPWVKFVESISISRNELELQLGDTYRLTAIVSPSDATYPVVKWSSSNTAVATVEGGLVTAVGLGEAVITVSAIDEGGASASCKLTVKEKSVALESLQIVDPNGNSSSIIKKGNTLQLTAIFTPENTTERNVRWLSLDDKVVTVDDNGLVKAVAAGATYINAFVGQISGSYSIIVEN